MTTTYAPAHICPNPASPAVATQLDGLHNAQAGDHRHVCTDCAYAAGVEAGEEAANRDRRRRSWTIDEPTQRCLESNAAPVSVLAALPASQGTHRWCCAVCAWALGFRAGAGNVLGV